MIEKPALQLITTERRKRDGVAPADRVPTRIEDIEALVKRTCASFDRVAAEAVDLAKKLAKG